jgi:hypothetical protein
MTWEKFFAERSDENILVTFLAESTEEGAGEEDIEELFPEISEDYPDGFNSEEDRDTTDFIKYR